MLAAPKDADTFLLRASCAGVSFASPRHRPNSVRYVSVDVHPGHCEHREAQAPLLGGLDHSKAIRLRILGSTVSLKNGKLMRWLLSLQNCTAVRFARMRFCTLAGSAWTNDRGPGLRTRLLQAI